MLCNKCLLSLPPCICYQSVTCLQPDPLAALVRLHAQRPDGEEVGASLDALLQGARAQLELQVQARIQQAVRGRGGAPAASGGVTTARRTSSSPPATVAR